jgi:DNA ligase (NAD+)
MEYQEAHDLAIKFIKIPATTNEIELLRKIIRIHDSYYYVYNNPLISDFEYDQLFIQLKKMEEQNPHLVVANSPTQRLSSGISTGFTNVAHLVPMLSLENSYNATDLIEWDRKVKELIENQNVEYVVEPKFDGAGLSVIYENDNFLRGATRGDGVFGDDITANCRQLKSLPLEVAFSSFQIDKIEIRGEVIIPTEKFIAINKNRIENNLPPFANPRNAAAGGLRLLDPVEVGTRGLEAFMYHISFAMDTDNGDAMRTKLASHSEAIDCINQLGIKSSKPFLTICNSIDDVVNCCNQWMEKRESLPYEIDGMVIKVNKFVEQEKCGYTAHHPKWAIAYKFPAKQATSKLLAIEYQVGRTGAVTPVAKIEPVYLSGVTISSLSLFNQDVIKEKGLMLFDKILIERSGDVIPYIVKSFAELRNGNEESIIFPANCPSCNSPLIKPEAEAVWRCENINCSAQAVERIIHFASKDAMNIKGLGDALVTKFYDLKLISNVVDLFKLDFDKFNNIEGFGEKSIVNLKIAIEGAKNQTLDKLLFALGIRYVGITTAETIARSINHINELKDISLEQLKQMDDVGIKVAQSIVDYFANIENIKLVDELLLLGVNGAAAQKIDRANLKLNGINMLFTGTLPTLGRSKAEAMAIANGATIAGSVNKKLNYLVVGEDAGSKLEKAQKINSIQIINEEEFLKIVQ